MKSISFAELTKQVHLINDLILSDMACGNNESLEEAVTFSRHLLATKYWFARISCANKKLYLLALLEDVKSAWALSLLLKSIWNCRPKDAVLSINDQSVWSSYDQVPMDHNRTALPITTLAQVMKNDRMWFLTLEPESQALVLSELLTIAGGPVMWAVLRRGQVLYERYRDLQLLNLKECIVVNEPLLEKGQQQSTPEKGKKDQVQAQLRKGSAGGSTLENIKQTQPQGQAHRELEANLAAWEATIKVLRDNLKLEELEMTFNDGTKRKLWKVNRPKPEVIETVDFLQLLPSFIGKRILSYLPRAQIGDYARVNKYWAYLVEELRSEIAARLKIDADRDKLHELMMRHDTSMDIVVLDEQQIALPSYQGVISENIPSIKARHVQPSIWASEKSGGAFSMRHFLNKKLNKQRVIRQTPIRNMAQLSERIVLRGAADENIWKWCDNVLKHAKSHKKTDQAENKIEPGVLALGNVHFPCPMMKECLEVPLVTPLYKDPAITTSTKPRRNILNTAVMNNTKESGTKRYSLWTRDFSGLYPVYKIPSHQSPV